MLRSNLKYFLLIFLSVGLVFVLSGFDGCSNGAILSKVKFKLEPNLETVSAKLIFADYVETSLGGSFDYAPYGTISVEPPTSDKPFSIGFRFNLDLLNNQDLMSLEGVHDLPNGQPLPIPNLNRALVRVQLKSTNVDAIPYEPGPNMNGSEKPIPSSEVYLYADVADQGKEWIGVAVTLDLNRSKHFPPGLYVVKQFSKDSHHNPRAIAAAFGPKVDHNKKVIEPGCLAFFINLKTLMQQKSSEKPCSGNNNVCLFHDAFHLKQWSFADDGLALERFFNDAFKLL